MQVQSVEMIALHLHYSISFVGVPRGLRPFGGVRGSAPAFPGVLPTPLRPALQKRQDLVGESCHGLVVEAVAPADEAIQAVARGHQALVGAFALR